MDKSLCQSANLNHFLKSVPKQTKKRLFISHNVYEDQNLFEKIL